MVKEYDRHFGLDRPLWVQYLAFLRDAARLDFNYSIANYPRTVNEMIAEALPWTVVLLGTTTIVSFARTILGALLACERPGGSVARRRSGRSRYSILPLWALLMYVLGSGRVSRCSAVTVPAPFRP
jgi:peptide/nickel transport system permease protein